MNVECCGYIANFVTLTARATIQYRFNSPNTWTTAATTLLTHWIERQCYPISTHERRALIAHQLLRGRRTIEEKKRRFFAFKIQIEVDGQRKGKLKILNPCWIITMFIVSSSLQLLTKGPMNRNDRPRTTTCLFVFCTAKCCYWKLSTVQVGQFSLCLCDNSKYLDSVSVCSVTIK